MLDSPLGWETARCFFELLSKVSWPKAWGRSLLPRHDDGTIHKKGRNGRSQLME